MSDIELTDLPDLSSYSEGELDTLRVALAVETEKRARLREAPQTIASIAQRFVEDGGDLADIHAALPSVEV